MSHKKTLAAYSITHFVIDFTCFYILMGSFSRNIVDIASVTAGMLLYNVLAFGTQMFIGFFADKYSLKHSNVAILGCVLVLIGVVNPFGVWTSLVICASGNAVFHVGGGIDSLKYSGGGMARGGIFVSFGAIGVVAGSIFGKLQLPGCIPIILLLLSSLAIYFASKKENDRDGKVFDTGILIHNEGNMSLSGSSIIFLCLISIAIRSFAGFEIPIGWKTNTFLYILPGLCAFSGKFAGGILADRFGARRIGVLSLILSIPMLCFFYNNIILCCMGIVLFNITMPVTLGGVAAQLPEQPGFAFGLTTLALLAGNVPTFFMLIETRYTGFVLPVLIIISAVCIFCSVNNKKGGYNDAGKNHILSEKLSV